MLHQTQETPVPHVHRTTRTTSVGLNSDSDKTLPAFTAPAQGEQSLDQERCQGGILNSSGKKKWVMRRVWGAGWQDDNEVTWTMGWRKGREKVQRADEKTWEQSHKARTSLSRVPLISQLQLHLLLLTLLFKVSCFLARISTLTEMRCLPCTHQISISQGKRCGLLSSESQEAYQTVLYISFRVTGAGD